MDCDFDRLDLSTNPYLEKNLEFLCNWIDDLSGEQFKFNQYTRQLQRHKQVLRCCRTCVGYEVSKSFFFFVVSGMTINVL